MVSTVNGEPDRPKKRNPPPDRAHVRQMAQESLGPAFAIYLVGVVVLVTLAPYELSWPPEVRFHLSRIYSREIIKDLIANVAMFVPVGFAFRLTFLREGEGWRCVLWSAALSLLVEGAQTVFPPRVTSPLDIATNAFGAWVGVLIFDAVIGYLDQKRVKDLALELPLAGVFYLLLPVLVAHALLVPHDVERIWLIIPVGLIGGIVVGSVSHHRLGPRGVSSPLGVTILVALWLLIACSPTLLDRRIEHVRLALFAALVTIMLVFVSQYMPAITFGRSRRFESAALRRIVPLFLIYLVANNLFPWEPLHQEFRMRWNFDQLLTNNGVVILSGVFAVIGHATSFVLLGYLLAGMRGRVRESRESMLGVVAFWTLVIVGTIEVLRGYHPEWHASLAHFLLAMASSVLGAYMYRMHQRTVWRILGRLPDG